MWSPLLRKRLHSVRCYPLRAAFLVLLYVLLLAGCASDLADRHAVRQLPPLQLDGRQVTLEQVSRDVTSPDLLAMDTAMHDFVQRYTAGTGPSQQKLVALHNAIRGQATLGLRYDPQAGGTAQEVFHRGTANCLSYASLLVAMARDAGLEARYQWLEVRPEWTREGERILVRLHVNALVKLKRGHHYMVDIDPLEPRDIAASREISDKDALALHHSNLAMEALAVGDLEGAWLQGVRALQTSPGLPLLWVNLGVIYRVAGQYRAAEDSYQYALRLDQRERSAMNNLAVLYAIEGRSKERDHWEQRVARYRDANPYYHAWLAQQAQEEGDWRLALRNYEKALSLAPQDSRLLYDLGMTYSRMGETVTAAAYVRQAMDTATLRSEIAAYQKQLRLLRHRQLAGT